MADAFLNYSRADAEVAGRIAVALQSAGLSVWWDRQLVVGDNFLEAIEAAMTDAACIVTIWSPSSITSEWVKAEAEFALRKNKLLPLAIGDDLRIPLAFGSIQTEFVGPNELAGNEWLARLARSVRDFNRRGRTRPRVIEEPSIAGVMAQAPRLEPPGAVTGAHASADAAARKKAFISHANEDELLAIELVKYLETAGCACWISFRDVDPGDDYRLSITKAMNEVAFLVLVYSQHVNTSFDIATELLLARKRQRKRFVLRTDDTEPAGPVEYELATVQWLDCRSNQQAAFERIAQRSALFR